ncbi:uncharacterized protein BBA_05069 [Beauveria bassiana ARSEF 2860]|uniref:Uncharacterized protein n=1 Tax=Beauveria bassiana (strain ARSEF 2860) TaxID=655819 RepID=J5JL36_BEAB2|nr:uncharacterized protein BBA_05069 [Beauveria bassiana ARSEF 2860]EJP66098.1 hypothetical protein BBA_05069 [Beauveria bassiana ARSEF 2860]
MAGEEDTFASPQGNLDDVDEEHRNSFIKALLRILHTEIAELTYSEILDGIPTSASYFDFYYQQEGHPAISHTELCPDVLDRTRQLRDQINPTTLHFSSSLLLSFQATLLGTRGFSLRLIELLAVSCHQIAVHLFQLQESRHTQEEYERWRDEPRDRNRWDWYRAPTAFCHRSYLASEQYPNGIADVCKEVYLHSSLRNGPQTLYPPTPLQFDNLMRFLLSEAELGYMTSNPPLPILASADNRWRWDAWEAFSRFHIFRDRYEQRIKPTTTTKPRKNCPSVTDWPEIADQLFLINAMYDRQAGKPVNENEVMAAKERLCQITPSSPVWNDDWPQQEPGPAGGRKEA